MENNLSENEKKMLLYLFKKGTIGKLFNQDRDERRKNIHLLSEKGLMKWETGEITEQGIELSKKLTA
jgi:hypothetical protein